MKTLELRQGFGFQMGTMSSSGALLLSVQPEGDSIMTSRMKKSPVRSGLIAMLFIVLGSFTAASAQGVIINNQCGFWGSLVSLFVPGYCLPASMNGTLENGINLPNGVALNTVVSDAGQWFNFNTVRVISIRLPNIEETTFMVEPSTVTEITEQADDSQDWEVSYPLAQTKNRSVEL